MPCREQGRESTGKDNMRILYAFEYHPLAVSGAAVMARRMAAWMSCDHTVSMICPNPPPHLPAYDQPSYKLILLPSLTNPFRKNYRFILPNPRRMSRIFHEVDPDVVHIDAPSPALLALIDLTLRAGRKLVISSPFFPQFIFEYIRITPKVSAPGGDQRVVAATMKILSRYYYDRADAIVVPTKTAKEFLQKYASPRIEAISCGVDYDRFASPGPSSQMPLAERIHRTCRPTVLCVSRLDKDKNLDVLLSAWRSVVERQAQNHLLMVGDGTERERLMRLAADWGIQDTITWPGMIAEADLPVFYQIPSVRVFLITSKIETQSIVTLQALAAGLPVVAASSGALPELVIAGSTGMLCPPDDPAAFAEAILCNTGQPERKRVPNARCQAIAREHSFERSSAAFDRLYRSLFDAAAEAN